MKLHFIIHSSFVEALHKCQAACSQTSMFCKHNFYFVLFKNLLYRIKSFTQPLVRDFTSTIRFDVSGVTGYIWQINTKTLFQFRKKVKEYVFVTLIEFSLFEDDILENTVHNRWNIKLPAICFFDFVSPCLTTRFIFQCTIISLDRPKQKDFMK